MKLNFIKTKKCPDCGCTTIVEESVQTWNRSGKPEIFTHCNGGTWEHRTFLCGNVVVFIPNYSHEAFKKTCTQSKAYKKEKKLIADWQRKVTAYKNKIPAEIIHKLNI